MNINKCCTDMRRDVQEIFKATPHEKQVMMFSATLPKELRPVCKKFMQDVRMLGFLDMEKTFVYSTDYVRHLMHSYRKASRFKPYEVPRSLLGNRNSLSYVAVDNGRIVPVINDSEDMENLAITRVVSPEPNHPQVVDILHSFHQRVEWRHDRT